MLQSCRGYFVTAAIFSLAINLLYLAGPLYMLQVYDRVIASASEITLLMLTIALLMALLALAGLDAVRARVLTRASIRLDQTIAARVMTAIIHRSAGAGGARSQLLRDFDTFRQFVTGMGIHAIFDLPWAPIYIAVIFVLHPFLGAFALGCSILLILMALFNEWRVKLPLTEAGEAASRSYSFTEMSLRNTEVVRAMGMTEGLLRRWARDRTRMLERQVSASDRAATMQSIIRFLRLAMQSMILGLGAYLVIERLATVGAMFAASILLGRALQPVEQIVGSWRNLVSARGAFLRIRELLKADPQREVGLTLPRPQGRLSVEGLSYVPPFGSKPILRGVSFAIEPGEVLGIIGPSGAGKSTLSRHLVGVLAPCAGAVRLDGADVSSWIKTSLGQHIGYLPQDIELFADTVAVNISRFQEGEDREVILAARMADVHEMILRLPDGYDTQVGEGGAILSGGYRQRIGLARAIFANPSLLVLDEPSSNLDAEGDAALADCILQLKKRGTTVVIISHRPATIGVADKILVLREGVVEMFGPRAEILARLTRPVPIHTVRETTG
ncbi:type I secretion system permease/ATPase [Bradyrhizobium canariense]|uniref:Type I secretion system permease/ATPase n=1 Tax=Bradyrhizobium canariense TaxID=255045 RepID=A0A1X3H339_9BRAD|nr:type I secretion system permease/ATPase [Bradyrhizobium canariense]OSI72498.1 type I secretion system permease/ATPase [Bradyrhizobium canariense]OSI83470.1 type I secretion system permease/ATPase [Bradyrhizobium canariense]OSI88781.1 type I secretion system permease/ATPase [Bradyrhizobium canariense]OSI97071.1 type I secretion system permease/ATPase [Bradyrhizobium canariense]